MLRYFIKRSQDEEFEEVKQPRGNFVWVCAEHTSAEDITLLAEKYDLDANILTDIRDVAELPRVEFNNGSEYIFLRTPSMSKKGSVVTKPFLAVIGADQFVSLFHAEMALPIPRVGGGMVIESQTRLLLGTTASLVSSYERLIQHTANTIKDTSDRLKTHEVTNRDFIHFVTVEQNLNEYRMNLDGMIAVMQRLYDNKHGLFSDEELETITDLRLHMQQLLVTIDTSNKRVDSIRNAYSTIANNNLNQRLKILTMLTLLVALPNVFYGMYGMNVLLPFADQPWAYEVIVGFTIMLIIFVYAVAKRIKLF